MATITTSFTAVASGTPIFVKAMDTLSYAITGTFVATLILEYSEDQKSWKEVKKFTAAASNSLVVDMGGLPHAYYRFRCSAFTSGTAETSLINVAANEVIDIFSVAKVAKVGATAGWLVGSAADTALVTLPAAETDSTLVVPLHFKVGEKIKGFFLVGQMESGGNTATLDCVLKKHAAVAADVSTSTLGTMTQVSVTADAALTRANTLVEGLVETVDATSTYFMLITGTTAAATDVALMGVGIIFEG